MKKLLLLFALVLTVCSTAMAEDLNVGSAVGTIGTLDGRDAMVVDLGGSIGKVAVAIWNVGAKGEPKYARVREGDKFKLADANDPEKNGLTDGWYVPSKAELDALKSHLTPNKGVHCVEWKVTETATLYLPSWSAGSNLYYGKYASSDREQVDDTWKCWIYEYLFYDSDNSFGGILEKCDEQETDNCLIRPFHKLPDDYYIDADGVSHNVNAYEVSSSDDQITWGEAGKESWYIVKGNDVTLSQGAICAGNVNLILADGAKLTATGIDEGQGRVEDTPGILVAGEGNSLTVYSQSADPATMGQLVANGGHWAAGIGGGYEQSSSNITINGGIVTATGVDSGAGIGGGRKGYGSNITINGGVVTATSKSYGAGIGGGDGRTGSNITINGGTVTAICGNPEHKGSGIGDSLFPTSEAGSGSGIYISSSLIAKAGDSEESALLVCNVEDPNSPFGTIDVAHYLAGKPYAAIEPTPAPEEPKEVTYIDENGIEQTVKANVVTSTPAAVTWGEPDKTSWYVVTGKDEQIARPICQGDVRLILADGAKLTANGYSYILSGNGQKFYHAGIHVSGEGNSLTIYDQAEHTGQLVAFGGECSAGIGGSKDAGGSNITINGGIVTATGGDGEVVEVKGRLQAVGGAAGIGGGDGGAGSNITINGGTVTANGGDGEVAVNETGKRFSGGAAGIGGGDGGAGSNITINGGTVTANGGETYDLINQYRFGGAGIGGGNGGSGSNIIINDGTVTANGGSNGTGIGGGESGAGSDITINGGVVTATGVRSGVGIGGGNMGSCSNITINGGIVTAIGKDYAAGIGCSVPEPPISGIFVSPVLTLKAGPTANPTNVIENTGGDLAEILNQYHYITVSDAVCNITANQDPNNKKHYYSTFYSGKKAYSVPEGVNAYTGVVNGDVLRLTAITGGIIPAGEAVILRQTSEDATEGKKKFALTATTTTATKSANNKLSGTDIPMTLGANDYALSLGQDGVGFYLWNGKPIDAHKAYLTLPSNAKAFTFEFGDDPSGIEEIVKPQDLKTSQSYNLNGIQVNENYKGIIIMNGKKYLQK